MHNSNKIKNTSGFIFYTSMLAIPVIQFIVFYVFVNINSVLLAFQKFDGVGFVFAGFQNFEEIYRELTTADALLVSLKNSFIVFGVTIVIEFFSLFFSYYIYKKYFLSQFFKFVLFFPSLVSGVVLGIIYLNLSDIVIPQIIYDISGKEIIGFLGQKSTRFTGNIVFYGLFYFGMRVIIYTSNMSAIPESVSEAAKLDGATPLDEFFKITFPLIIPSIESFLLFAVAAIMTNALGTYSLYGINAPNEIYTVGYYLTSKTMMTTGLRDGYPFLAALGVIISIITIPLVLITKFVIEKYSEKVEG